MSDLFETGIAAPARRGWAALPVTRRTVDLGALNPTRRRTLVFEYRRLRGWTGEHVARAEHWLTELFRRVGGFYRADQAAMSAWVHAVALWTDAQIERALAAKAESLIGADEMETRRRRLRYTPSPKVFAGKIDEWLARIDAWQVGCEIAAQVRGAVAAPLDDAPLPPGLLREILDDLAARRARLRSAGVPLRSGEMRMSDFARAARAALQAAYDRLPAEQRAAIESECRAARGGDDADTVRLAALCVALRLSPRAFDAALVALAAQPAPAVRPSDPAWARAASGAGRA